MTGAARPTFCRAEATGRRPLVSAVVIFLDEARYLGEAVESVLAQTYPAWELLLMDDGSTDGSTALAQMYAAREPDRVRYLDHAGHRNLGMSASRNAGLAAARGEYVAFLDADDVLVATALEEQVALLEAHPEAAMTYGPAEWWHSWTGAPSDVGRDRPQSLGLEPDRLVDGHHLLAVFLLDEGTHPTGPLYRCAALRAVNGSEEQFRGMYEDQVVRTKLCLRFPAYVSSRRWYRYRQRPDSCCATTVRRREHQWARARFLCWVGAYLEQHHIRHREVRRALLRARWQCGYRRILEVVQGIRAPVVRGIRRLGAVRTNVASRMPISGGLT